MTIILCKHNLSAELVTVTHKMTDTQLITNTKLGVWFLLQYII